MNGKSALSLATKSLSNLILRRYYSNERSRISSFVSSKSNLGIGIRRSKLRAYSDIMESTTNTDRSFRPVLVSSRKLMSLYKETFLREDKQAFFGKTRENKGD